MLANKRLFSLLFIALALLGWGAPAVAQVDASEDEGSYYVELGSGGTADAAKAEWDSLVAANKRLLSKLNFYPKQVLQQDNKILTLIQAGPISRKTQADRICKRMFARGTSCFVMEGVVNAPPRAAASLGRAAVHAANVGDTRRSVPAQGQVIVAEAVQVPLSDTMDSAQARVSAPVAVSQSDVGALPSQATLSTRAAGRSGGWLYIDSFTSEKSATAFWRELRANSPAQAAGLRVSFTTPQSRGDENARVALNAGPFPGAQEAQDFCRTAVLTIDASLRCRFGDEMLAKPSTPAASPAKTVVAGNVLTDESTRPTLASPAAIRSGRIYWVELFTAESEAAAIGKWTALRDGNPDLLQGYRPSITASLNQSNAYTLRVGPLGLYGDASELCENLANRKVECRVLSNN